MDKRELAYAYTRGSLERLRELRRDEPVAARGAFLYRLLSAASEQLLKPQIETHIIQELLRSVAGSDCEPGRFARIVGHAEDLDEVPYDLRRDPTLIGWCYQSWNEPHRDQSSWAISTQVEQQSELVDIGVVTQLFTDEYLAEFIVKRCRDLFSTDRAVGAPAPRICDPACGVGHFLLAAIRGLSSTGGDPGSLVENLWGFDIDPCAVLLARALVFLELMHRSLAEDARSVWATLSRQIVALKAPYGTLSRSFRELGLPQSFDIVVTNPPYLGRRKLPAEMRFFLDAEYPSAKIDLCAAFIQRCIELTASQGVLGLLTSDKWIRLRGYAPLREGNGAFRGIFGELSLDLLCELGERAFHPSTALHDGVKAAVVCARKSSPALHHSFSLCSVVAQQSYQAKVAALEHFSRGVRGGVCCESVQQQSFRGRDAGSVMLQVSSLPGVIKNSERTVSSYADVVVGIQTNGDDRFVRYVWEVLPGQPGWREHVKGGGYARWGGLNRWVINWEVGHKLFFKTSKAQARAEEWAERAGWCYTWFANGALGLRPKASGATIGRAAASGVFCIDERIVAFLNSRVASIVSRTMGGKIQLPEGVVREIPAPASVAPISLDLMTAITAIKSELVKGDISDARFEPHAVTSRQKTLVLEALLLTLEGILEGHVEQALGLDVEGSKRVAEIGGVPVAWFPSRELLTDHELWGHIPAKYRSFRGLITSTRKSSLAMSRQASMDVQDLSEIILGKKRAYSRQYVLPTTGTLEYLCRVVERHPFDVAIECLRLLDTDASTRAELCFDTLCTGVASDLLRVLGHRWWSEGGGTYDFNCAGLGGTELSLLVRESAARCGQEDVIRGSSNEWIYKKFIPWQEKRFCKRSPIIVSNEKLGDLRFFHRQVT